MTRTKSALVGTAIVLVIGASVALAAGKSDRWKPQPIDLDRLARLLDLNDEQTAAIGAIEDRTVQRAIDIHGDIVYAEYELGRMLLADEPERAAIFAKIDELSSLHAEKRKVEIGGKLDQRVHLTPEQRDKFRATRVERQLRREERRSDRQKRRGLETDRPPAATERD